jgi:hypothetical protein
MTSKRAGAFWRPASRAPGTVQQRLQTFTAGPGGTFSVTDTVVVRPKLPVGLSRKLIHRNRPVYVRGSVLPRSSGQRVYL